MRLQLCSSCYPSSHQEQIHQTQATKGIREFYSMSLHQQFVDTNLTTTYTVAAKKFVPISRKILNSRWNSLEEKQTYLTTSPQSWLILKTEEKAQHTLRGCEAC